MGKKGLSFIKNLISIFPGQCPQCATMSLMCNTFLGSLGVAHWGTTGVFFLGSTRDQINKQYKKMAILLHPDKSLAPGAEEAFKLLTIARSQLLRYAN